jgi:hypothetical protein
VFPGVGRGKSDVAKFQMDHVARVGRHGYQVIPNWRLTEGGLALHLKKLFEVEKIDFVVPTKVSTMIFCASSLAIVASSPRSSPT